MDGGWYLLIAAMRIGRALYLMGALPSKPFRSSVLKVIWALRCIQEIVPVLDSGRGTKDNWAHVALCEDKGGKVQAG